jgi:hypothetical protein
MADVQTSEVDAKLETVNVEPWNFVNWKIFKGWTTFNKTIFVKKKKKTNMTAVWMLKFIVCFVEKTHKSLHEDNRTLV